MFEITLKFLEAVSRNNSTERLHTYRDLYQQEKKRFADFVWKLLEEAKKVNPLLEDLQVKDCIYRFNKDIRFSKDKKPYKENFWAILTEGWKKSWNPCFYFHLQPGNKSFITWWVYFPTQINENKVRAHLLLHFDERLGFLEDKKLNSFFHLDEPMHSYKTTARLKALVKKNPELKENNPFLDEYWLTEKFEKYVKDWKSKNRAEELLAQLAFYKDWGFTHELSDKDVCSPKLFDEIRKGYQLVLPVINFFQEAYDGPEYQC